MGRSRPRCPIPSARFYPAELEFAGEGYRWLQVFTIDTLGPDRRRKAVAIEPMTCPPNAFVTAHDLLVLEPGQAVTPTWGIQVFDGKIPNSPERSVVPLAVLYQRLLGEGRPMPSR